MEIDNERESLVNNINVIQGFVDEIEDIDKFINDNYQFSENIISIVLYHDSVRKELYHDKIKNFIELMSIQLKVENSDSEYKNQLDIIKNALYDKNELNIKDRLLIDRWVYYINQNLTKYLIDCREVKNILKKN